MMSMCDLGWYLFSRKKMRRKKKKKKKESKKKTGKKTLKSIMILDHEVIQHKFCPCSK